jgi:hypothetical protein
MISTPISAAKLKGKEWKFWWESEKEGVNRYG